MVNPLTSRTYIGIGITTRGCAVIATCSSQDNPGTYLLSRDWFSRITTYDGIINAVSEALKIREIPVEDLKRQKLELLESGKINVNRIAYLDRGVLINHFYSVVTFKEPKVESELNKLKPYCSDIQQNIICTVSNPYYDKENLITCTSGLINDNKIQYNTNLDINAIKDEISTIIEPEDFNKLTPQLLALCLSIGEAEFRRVDNREDYGYSIMNSANTALNMSLIR